jgi:hypothetical protein
MDYTVMMDRISSIAAKEFLDSTGFARLSICRLRWVTIQITKWRKAKWVEWAWRFRISTI